MMYRDSAKPLDKVAPNRAAHWTLGDVWTAFACALLVASVAACAWLAPTHARDIVTCEKRGGVVRGFVVPGRYTVFGQECKGAVR